MKKINVAALVTVLTFASCMQEMEVPMAGDGEIYAKIEQEDAATKTVLDPTNNVCWCEEDQIVAFMKTSSVSCYQIKEAYVGSDQGYFSEVSSGESDKEEWKENVVYYPYSEAVKCEKAETGYNLQIDLPSKQTYTADSFGNHAFPMAAVSKDNNFTFKNICGGVKLQLKGSQSLQSIRIEGKNGEILSGGATVTLDGIGAVPSIAMEAEGSTSVILECNAIQLKEDVATTFIITLPPTVFSKGFIVSIADTDGQTYILETDKKNSVLRSSLLVMPRKELDSSVKYSFWDGKIPINSPLTQDPASSQTYIIDEAADLAWLSRASNAASIGEGKTLVLKANINMGK